MLYLMREDRSNSDHDLQVQRCPVSMVTWPVGPLFNGFILRTWTLLPFGVPASSASPLAGPMPACSPAGYITSKALVIEREEAQTLYIIYSSVFRVDLQQCLLPNQKYGMLVGGQQTAPCHNQLAS